MPTNQLVDSLVAEHGGQIIAEMRASDGFVNATKMCKAGGKRWFNYIQNEDTKKFMDELKKPKAGIPAFENLVISQRGHYGGTWVHPQVAIHLAAWISPAFAVQVTSLVQRYTTGQVTTQESVQAAEAISQRVTVVADVPEQLEPQFRLKSVTGVLDLRCAQLYAREVLGFTYLRKRGSTRNAAEEDTHKRLRLDNCIVVKFGCMGDWTDRQGTHMKQFEHSRLIDSFPTLAYSHVEQKLKDYLLNQGMLYEGIHMNKKEKDVELVVFESQAEYEAFVEIIKTLLANTDDTTPLELLLAIEKTKQAQELTVQEQEKTKRMQIDLEILQLRIANPGIQT